MCPPNPELKLAALNISIRDSWSEEELVRFLAERKAEDPLPQDVLVGLDFSLVDPRIFTVDTWYLSWSDDEQPNNSAENSIRKAKKWILETCGVMQSTNKYRYHGRENYFGVL